MGDTSVNYGRLNSLIPKRHGVSFGQNSAVEKPSVCYRRNTPFLQSTVFYQWSTVPTDPFGPNARSLMMVPFKYQRRAGSNFFLWLLSCTLCLPAISFSVSTFLIAYHSHDEQFRQHLNAWNASKSVDLVSGPVARVFFGWPAFRRLPILFPFNNQLHNPSQSSADPLAF